VGRGAFEEGGLRTASAVGRSYVGTQAILGGRSPWAELLRVCAESEDGGCWLGAAPSNAHGRLWEGRHPKGEAPVCS